MLWFLPLFLMVLVTNCQSSFTSDAQIGTPTPTATKTSTTGTTSESVPAAYSLLLQDVEKVLVSGLYRNAFLTASEKAQGKKCTEATYTDWKAYNQEVDSLKLEVDISSLTGEGEEFLLCLTIADAQQNVIGSLTQSFVIDRTLPVIVEPTYATSTRLLEGTVDDASNLGTAAIAIQRSDSELYYKDGAFSAGTREWITVTVSEKKWSYTLPEDLVALKDLLTVFIAVSDVAGNESDRDDPSTFEFKKAN